MHASYNTRLLPRILTLKVLLLLERRLWLSRHRLALPLLPLLPLRILVRCRPTLFELGRVVWGYIRRLLRSLRLRVWRLIRLLWEIIALPRMT